MTARLCVRQAPTALPKAALPKRKKGDKVAGGPAVDLDRIMGYHSDEDSGGSAKSSAAESEADAVGAPLGGGGIMDRCGASPSGFRAS